MTYEYRYTDRRHPEGDQRRTFDIGVVALVGAILVCVLLLGYSLFVGIMYESTASELATASAGSGDG